MLVIAGSTRFAPMRDSSGRRHFEATVLVHLDAAYNLARWLLGDDASAEDAVQSGCLRALRGFGAMSGPNAKAWFLAIVRNCCMDVLRERRRWVVREAYDEALHGSANPHESPEAAALRAAEVRLVREAITALPNEFREVIVLRDLEGLSYKEIGAIVNVPIGTVMSRLARGRERLGRLLSFVQAQRLP
jgi:RNA polymerase sigma-70 factor, ECF subfamily